MLQTFPQIGPNRLSGDDDEWRILIRWKQEAPTAIYTIPEALSEAERLQERAEALLVRAQRGGIRLLASGLSEHYREILALTRLDEAIEIHEDETAAIAAVKV